MGTYAYGIETVCIETSMAERVNMEGGVARINVKKLQVSERFAILLAGFRPYGFFMASMVG